MEKFDAMTNLGFASIWTGGLKFFREERKFRVCLNTRNLREIWSVCSQYLFQVISFPIPKWKRDQFC